LPSQLANPSKKFQWKEIEKDARKRDYETSIDWLERSNLVLYCHLVKTPEIPLAGFVDNNTFKLYLSDVGVLTNILKLNMEDILNDNISLYKGIIAENFVATELACRERTLYYWKSENTSKVDFLLNTKEGIIPIEVKAGENTQSKSLKVYMEKHHPKYGFELVLKILDMILKQKLNPSYFMQHFCCKHKKEAKSPFYLWKILVN